MLPVIFLLLTLLQRVEISFSFLFDKFSKLEIQKLTDFILDDFAFEKHYGVANPFLSYILNDDRHTCPNAGLSAFGNHKLASSPFLEFPEFHSIYSDCKKTFTEGSECLSTCIFHGIFKREKYGQRFLTDVISNGNSYIDSSKPYPHQVPYELNLHSNIFCLNKEFRSALLNKMLVCNLTSTLGVCVIDEEELHCDPKEGNCHFGEKQISVLTVVNKAHPVTCGTLDTVKWEYFDKSSKNQCLLPKTDWAMSMIRPVFNKCELCSNDQKGGSTPVLEYLKSPTKEEFAKVAFSSLPIIIRNGAKDAGMPQMNISSIKEFYRHVDNNSRDGKPCQFSEYSSPFTSFEEALSIIKDGVQWDSSWYISWKVCHPEVLKRVQSVLKRPKFLPVDHISDKIPRIFVGGDGVSFHVDYLPNPVWQAQLAGNKTWFLRPPPECLKVCTKWIRVKISQGDIFVIQINTWHHETLIKNGTLSIAYSEDYE